MSTRADRSAADGLADSANGADDEEAEIQELTNGLILVAHDTAAPALNRLGTQVVELLEVLFGSVRTHSISHRVKGRESLERKLREKPGKYRALEDVTDVLGLRVITYFPDEVDQLAKILEDHFEIDLANSVDRRATLEPDRFGYLSLHYVVRLSTVRQTLEEYGTYRTIRFEVQLRSILQHAWAEIEHDLGYHGEEALPSAIRRRFSRLAGLLEIADSEFALIRDDVAAYRNRLEGDILNRPHEVPLSLESIHTLIRVGAVVRAADTALLEPFGATKIAEPERGYAEGRVEEMGRLGLRTIAAVQTELASVRDTLPKFATAYLGREMHDDSVSAGISLFYLYLFEIGRRLATRKATLAQAQQLLAGRGGEDQKWARHIRDAYKLTVNPEAT